MRTGYGIILCLLFTLTHTSTGALIEDNFESQSTDNYTRTITSGGIVSTNYSYNYIAAGIPLAPHATAGDSNGLRMTVNDSFAKQQPTAQTVFHHTRLSGLIGYTLQVDIYMAVTGTGTGSSTTEFANVGIAADGTTLNSLVLPSSGSGHYLGISGDGLATSDYRHWMPLSGLINSGDISYLNSEHTTNASGDTYQSIFPDTDFPGSPGNTWTTLTIRNDGVVVTYALDGTPIIRCAAEAVDGYISLGYHDPFYPIAVPHYSQFVIYDNLVVTEIVPEPASAALLGLAGLALTRRR